LSWQSIEHGHVLILLADVFENGQKMAQDMSATVGEKLNEARNIGEHVKTKASDSFDQLYVSHDKRSSIMFTIDIV
jgi:hypothetical protein